MASEAGKGSTQRPTNADAYASGWDRIFGKKNVSVKSITQEVQEYNKSDWTEDEWNEYIEIGRRDSENEYKTRLEEKSRYFLTK